MVALGGPLPRLLDSDGKIRVRSQELLPRLVQELVPVGENEHSLLHLEVGGHLGENHGLARSRGEGDELPPDPPEVGFANGPEALDLVITEL